MKYPAKITAPGCDDAPFAQIEPGMTERPVTIVLPYYENPRMLEFQLEHFLAFAPAMRARITLILVDDGSQLDPISPEHLKYAAKTLHIRCFRLKVDVRWNWLAARNLGVYHAAPGSFCLLTDIDHLIPYETAEVATTGRLDPGTVYRFARRRGGEEVHPHPNSWLLTDAMFWAIGGYDEALSGYYGTDGEFRRRVAKTAPIRILTAPLVHLEGFLDSYTTIYGRKQLMDATAQKLIAARGPNWRPAHLTFPWEEIGVDVSREKSEQPLAPQW